MRVPDAITTDRLRIRPFRARDLPGYLRFMSDPESTRYLLLTEEQKTEAGATELFEFVRESYESDEPIWALAIADKRDQFVGSCGVSKVEDGVFECYYSLLPACQGRGYATEATRALMDYLFEHSGMAELRAYMSPENPRSAGVARRLGMTCRGTNDHPLHGTKGLLYSISREEWKDQEAGGCGNNTASVQTQFYDLRRVGHAVFVTWHQSIAEWPPGTVDDYLETLRQMLRASIEPSAWRILTAEVDGRKIEGPEYLAYVESVRDHLVEEFHLDPRADDVGLSAYHGDQLVISFEAESPEDFPRYYRGVQLKPRLHETTG
jgi:RimJ/RimL family protein N-acetyltransferase